jgi:DNA-binding protein H-NS
VKGCGSGKNPYMTNPRLEDHLVGLELQLVELVETKQRAEVQGRNEDATVLAAEIAALQGELATTAERIVEAEEGADPAPKAVVAAPTAARAA